MDPRNASFGGDVCDDPGPGEVPVVFDGAGGAPLIATRFSESLLLR
jgi:hypothetical protein